MPAFRLATLARLSRAAAALLCLAFALLCLARAHLIGDGMEYLTMAQGFVAHGSPELRRSDVEAFRQMPAKSLARGHLRPDTLDQAIDRLEQGALIELGYARAKDGSIQAIHFWMYSLLAVPFYALVALLGGNPFMALVALNLVILGVSAWRVRAWFPQAGLPLFALLAIMGPLYYAKWIGPEVMAGCCVLLATLAALRRDLPLSVLLAGLGATQNPSIAGLIPAAAAWYGLYRLFPGLALCAPRARQRPVLLDGALVVGGVVLATLPYLHNQAAFGMPSIISRYYTDLGLVTPERLFSFLFDLNQGLFTGFPALVSCAGIIALRIGHGARRAWLLHAAIALLLSLGLALPTLAATNWNSGALIVSRYAYWSSMPMLAVCFAGLLRLDTRSRMAAVGVALVLQALAGWQAHRPGVPAFVTHGRLAELVLDHAPRWYNPDPEIFVERERRSEAPYTLDEVVLHQGPQGPTKAMRFWSNGDGSGGLCTPGTYLAAGHVATLVSGWRYYNAPLRCDPGPAPIMRLAVGAPGGNAPVLGAGWSRIEGGAVWSDGVRSTLQLPVPPGRRARRIALEGHYFEGVSRSRVSINGIALGDIALGPKPLDVPETARAGAMLEVTLEHANPVVHRPDDPRALAYRLRGAVIEFEP